ncbi:MAG: DUF370 domain-containing protein [Oscillospiraceae bacterium]|jgi:hypothetical protein|nr:DUF370 domain-containing protein [Oscillospiraceae bacterium]
MFLHIGGQYTLPEDDIVGLFDLDGTSRGKGTIDFLASREKDGRLSAVEGKAIPRSFVVTAGDRVFLTQITVKTLRHRLDPVWGREITRMKMGQD